MADPPAGPAVVHPACVAAFSGFVAYSVVVIQLPPAILDGSFSDDVAAMSDASRSLVAGAMLAIVPFFQACGAPFIGRLADRKGRKVVWEACLVALTVAYTGASLAMATGSLALLSASLVVAGLADANLALAQAAIADVTHDAGHTTRAFGTVYVATSAAWIFGPLLVLSGLSTAKLLLLTAALLCASVIFHHSFFEETLAPAQRAAALEADEHALSTVLRSSPSVKGHLALNFVGYLAIFAYFRGLSVYLTLRFAASAETIGVYTAVAAVPLTLAFAVLVPWATARFEPNRVAQLGFVGLAGGLVAVTLVGSLGALLVATLCLATTPIGLAMPAIASSLVHVTERSDMGVVLGFNNGLSKGAEASAGLVNGMLFAWGAAELPYVLWAFVALAAAGVLTTPFFRHEHRPNPVGQVRHADGGIGGDEDDEERSLLF